MSALSAFAWDHAAADGHAADPPVVADTAVRRVPARGRAPVSLRPPLPHATRWGAFVAALLLQSAIAVALLLGLSPKWAHDETQVLQVAIVPPAAKPPPKVPPPHSVLIKEHAVEVTTLPELHFPQVAPVISRVPARSVPTRPATPPPSIPVVAKTTATFEQQMLAAVQASVDGHYPPAARLLRQQGQAEIGFDYLDADVSRVALVQSSGSRVLDKAALVTVREAHFPAPPAKLLHRLQHYEVWVKFRLDPELKSP